MTEGKKANSESAMAFTTKAIIIALTLIGGIILGYYQTRLSDSEKYVLQSTYAEDRAELVSALKETNRKLNEISVSLARIQGSIQEKRLHETKD